MERVPPDARVIEVLGHIGANLLALRQRRGLTQQQLADAADVDLRFLQRLEQGQHNVSVAVLVALADALTVVPSRLFRETEAPPPRRRGRPRKTRK
jgi:transcriptional regulator with XRE-family HTH domain